MHNPWKKRRFGKSNAESEKEDKIIYYMEAGSKIESIECDWTLDSFEAKQDQSNYTKLKEK